jgi:hypothetical protein
MHTRLNMFAVLKFPKKEDSLLTNLTILIGIIRNKEKSNRGKFYFINGLVDSPNKQYLFASSTESSSCVL